MKIRPLAINGLVVLSFLFSTSNSFAQRGPSSRQLSVPLVQYDYGDVRIYIEKCNRDFSDITQKLNEAANRLGISKSDWNVQLSYKRVLEEDKECDAIVSLNSKEFILTTGVYEVSSENEAKELIDSLKRNRLGLFAYARPQPNLVFTYEILGK